MKKRKWIRPLLIAFCTLAIATTVSAKFWGWETVGTPTDWSDGKCMYRETCRVHYIFWIAGEVKCETVTIACLED